MKKTFAIVFLAFMVLSVQAQTKLDQLFMNQEIRHVMVEEVGHNFIKFKYPNENASYTISKHLVEKIEFSSGRVEKFESSFKSVKSSNDFSNVYITYVPQDVENLKSIGSIFSKAVGVTTLSSINNVNNRAINKMKIEAAMMGANIIYIGNVYQRGNQYGNENIPGNATMTSISGTAYSSMSSFDLNHAKNQLEKLEFVLLQIDKLNRNSFDKYTEFLLLQDEKYKPNTFHFQEVKIIDEELYVKTNQFKSKTGNLKVIFMDDKMLTLMERKGNSIYNYVLISENDTRIIKMKEIYQNKRQ